MHPNLRVAKHQLLIAGLSLFAFACKPPSGTVTGTIALVGGGNPSGALASAAGRVVMVAQDGSFTIPEVPAGTVTVRATDEGYEAQEQTVTVEGGKEVTASFTLVRASTSPHSPVLSALSAAPSQLPRGGTASVQAVAVDPDGDPLTYIWTATGGFTVTGAADGTATLTAPQASGASGSVQVVVADGTGGTATGVLLVSTAPNSAPVLTSITATPPSVQKGDTITLQASATDPEGDTLSYAWTAPAGWNLTGTGSTVSVTAPATPATSAAIEVQVTDASGSSTRGSVVVSTRPNTTPQVSSITATPTPAPRGGNVTLSVSASDPDGDLLSYVWTVDDPTWILTPNGAQASVAVPDALGVSATVMVEVSDGLGGMVSGVVTVYTRSNLAPFILDLQAGPTPVLPGSSLTATVNAVDVDGDTLTYGWTSTPATWTKTGTGASVSFRAPFLNNASATLDVVVSDPNGAQAARGVLVATSSCPGNTMNCDGDTANGCETPLNSSPNNCGACGNACPPATPACVQGACVTQLQWTGVRNDVPVSEVIGGGWSQCHVSDYNTATPLSTILAACNKAKLMLACRATGSSTLRLAAHAPRADVLFDTGTGNVPHNANGVGWYFNSNWSWGYAAQGAVLFRNNCDLNETGRFGGTPIGPTSNTRLCNHTNGGSQDVGWRCGDQFSLNFSTAWERLIFQAD